MIRPWIARTSQTRQRPSRAVTGAALAVALGLSACSGGGSPTASSDSFSVGILNNFVDHLTPGAGANSFLDYALFTPLTTINSESSEVEMAVAESISSSDKKVWDIALEKDWEFSDGTPVTAQSFADAWNATALGETGWIGNSQFNIIKGYDALNPATGEAEQTKLEGVEVVDKWHLEVTLNTPNSTFPYMLSQTTFAPMPKSAFSDLKAYDKKPVGNGPYKIQGEGIGPGTQTLTLERNDSYAGDKGNVETIQVDLFQSSNAAYTAFKSGSVDLVMVDGADYADAQNRYENQMVSMNAPAVVYLGFPLWNPRFKDLDTRKALAQAIDRDTIAKTLLRGSADPATTLAPPSLLGSEGIVCETCRYEPSAAKSVLNSWEGDLTLWTNDDPTQAEVLKAIGNEFRSLGVDNVKTKTQDTAQIYTNLAEKKIDGPFLLYTGVSYPHIYALTKNLFTPSPYNVTGYSNSQVDSLLAEAARAEGSDESVAKSKAAAERALKDVPLTPVYFPKLGLVHAPSIGNVTPEVLGGPKLADVTVN